MAEPARVLHVVGGMGRGGAETMIMNLYRQLDRSRLQFDFLCTRPGEHSYDAEIRDLGGRIIHIDGPAKAGYRGYMRQMRHATEKNGPFRAMHAHTLFNAGLVAVVAKRAGVPVRVCHSHNTSDGCSSEVKRCLYSIAMRMLIHRFATHYVACGENAGRYLFGNRAVDAGRVCILQNGLDLDDYRYLNRDAEKQKYDGDFGFNGSSVVFGHVAGFRVQKNHVFLVRLMSRLQSAGRRYKLVLVGDGERRPETESLVAELGLQDRVVFTGVRADIPELMTYFDVFVLPSLYEGLPMTVIEAQAAGTPCVLSDRVTREVDQGLGLVDWVSLDDIDGWLEAVERALRMPRPGWHARQTALIESGYSCRHSTERLYELYGLKSHD